MYEQQIDLFSSYTLNPTPSAVAKPKVVTKVAPTALQPRSPVSTLNTLKHPAGTATVRAQKRQPKTETVTKEPVTAVPKPKATAPAVATEPKLETVAATVPMPNPVTTRRTCQYIAIAPGEAIVPEPPFAIYFDCEAAKTKKA